MIYLKFFSNSAAVGNGVEVNKPNVSHLKDKNVVYVAGGPGTAKIKYNSTTDKIELDPYNDYPYVDLALPSGTIWAKCNVGAQTETDYGLYFQWGDTQGYADASTKTFNWETYKYCDGTVSPTANNLTKYNSTDGLVVLELSDDAARANMGGGWKIPNNTQIEELFNTANTTYTWETNYQNSGHNGALFTSKINGATLFIPAAGLYNNASNTTTGSTVAMWKNGLDYKISLLYLMIAISTSMGPGRNVIQGQRSAGFPVRGVITPNS